MMAWVVLILMLIRLALFLSPSALSRHYAIPLFQRNPRPQDSHAASQVISPDKSAAAASEGKNKLAVETKSTSGIVDVTAAINALMAGADDTAGNALQPRSVNNSHESSDVVSPQTAQRKKWSVDKDPKFSVTVAESAPSSAALVQEQVFAQAKVPVCWFLPP